MVVASEHPMTTRCKIAVARARKVMVTAETRLSAAQAAYDSAAEELRQAQYDLSLNEGLDEGRYGKARRAS